MSDIPTGRLNRLVRLASLGPRVGGSLLLGEGRRRAVADRMLHTLGELKGGSMKIGQILAQVADAGLPAEFQDRLAGLFDEADTMPWERVAPVLEEEIEDLGPLAVIDPEPFAGASLGQVHRAELRDGRVVAVKIQYPHVGEALAQDLANLRQLARVGTGGGLVLDVSAQVEALRDAVTAELDYRQERESMEAMAGLLAPWSDLVVPATVPELCGRRVLTTELLDGPTLHHAGPELSGAHRERLAHLLVRAVLLPLLVGHRLNADAHPGNFVVLPGPRLGLLDFGAVRDMPAHVAAGLRQLLRAVLRDPSADIAPALDRMGFDLDRGHSRVRRGADAIRDILVPVLTGPHDFAADHTLAALGEYKQRHPLDALHFVPEPALVHLMRALLGLLHGLRLLGVTADLSPTLAEVAEVRSPGRSSPRG